MATNTLRNDADDSVFKDPVTGTTPVGPLEPAEDAPEVSPARWSMAARWIVVGLIILIVAGFVLSHY